MKKLHYFLSLALALTGWGTAQAQNYGAGQQLTTEAQIANAAAEGTTILLRGATVQSHNGSNYITPAGFVSAITDATVYKLEATGSTVDGYPTYRLISQENGQYLRAEVYGDLEDTSNGVEGSDYLHAYTSNVSDAYTFTVLHPVAGSTHAESPRTWVANDNIGENTWVLAEDKEQPDGVGIGYFGTYESGFMSIYGDTNQWEILVARKLTGGEKLQAFLSANMPGGMNAWSKGDGVGQVPATEYDALEKLFDEASQIKASDDISDEELESWTTRLTAAIEAANAAVKGVEDGKYYFFENANYSSYYMRSADGSNITAASYNVPASAAAATTADAAYIWKVIAAEDGKFYLQHFATGKYGGIAGSTSGIHPLTDQPQSQLTIALDNGGNNIAGGFNIRFSENPAEHASYHTDGSHNVVRWTTRATASVWKITECTEIANALNDMVAQEQLNTELTSLLSSAKTIYNKGRVFSADGMSEDGNWDDYGLVTDPAMLSTNAQELSEGPIESLVDGNFETYFHSRWNAQNDGTDPTTYHYVQADLGQAVQTLSIKYAKRHNNQTTYNPTKVRVEATNDVNGEWTDCGIYDLTYTYSAFVNNQETANFIGIATFEMPEAFRHVRISVLEHQMSGGEFNGYPYFYLSELHYYASQYDPEKSVTFEQVPEAIRTALYNNISTAEAELANNAATSATIASLTTAYQDFVANFADVSILNDSIAYARSLVSEDLVSDMLGLYSQAAVDEFNNTVDEVAATAVAGMSVEAIQAGLQTLREAIAKFNASFNYPTVGAIYTLRGLTTSDSNTRALNAPIYSLGNSETTALRSREQVDGTDPVDISTHLNYLWKVISAADGKIVLRNLGTGYYMGGTDEINGAVPNVAEPVELGLEPVKDPTHGGFFIKVGTDAEYGDLYLNFAGQRELMVGWNSHSGLDNSALAFEEVNMEEWGQVATSGWTVSENIQVLTLPVTILTPNPDGEGTAYSVLGQKTDGENYTIELSEIQDYVIPAGTPFVFVPVADLGGDLPLIITDENGDNYRSINDIEYVTEAKATGNGALTGALSSVVIEEPGKAILNNGSAVILGGREVWGGYEIAANSGYFNHVTTEETGDHQIVLSGDMLTGIENATIVDAKATVDVYTISGVRVRAAVKAADATNGLPSGIYVVGGKKVYVK